MVHARDNAEAIALYGGEQVEARQLRGRFSFVVGNFKRLILWQRHLSLFTSAYSNAASLVPYFMLAGAYFSGRFGLGRFTQAAFAFSMLQDSLSLIVNQFQSLTDYASVVNRLAAFTEECTRAPACPGPRGIEIVEGSPLSIQHLWLTTPDGKRDLVRGLSLEVRPGDSLLIMGPSGAGKTSLVRALAGLWRFGEGRIVRPPLEQIIFQPQRPYMLLGSMRDQLTYPGTHDLPDQALLGALAAVNLADLPSRFGGLDCDLNWAEVLSLGEQQRLAFARLLLNHPRYAILDEATSALDPDNEDLLYRRLGQTDATVISVAHRRNLLKFHRQVLDLGTMPDAPSLVEMNGAPVGGGTDWR